jgi:hypothetical protein
MLARWLAHLEKVHIAESEEEREAIFRFRYRVYVEELNKGFLEVDHGRRWIRDPEDDRPGTTLFYTGTPHRVTGTFRTEVWQPGEVPPHVFERFSLHLFPGVEDQEVAETSRLIIGSTFRGRFILPSLAWRGYQHLCQRDNTWLVFCYCAPGLVSGYRRLGYRPYKGSLVCNQDGVRVPLVGVLSDVEYARKVGSPVTSLIRRYFGHGRGRRPPLDLQPIRHVLDSDPLPFEAEPERVWQHLQEEVVDDPPGSWRICRPVPSRSWPGRVFSWTSQRGGPLCERIWWRRRCSSSSMAGSRCWWGSDAWPPWTGRGLW